MVITSGNTMSMKKRHSITADRYVAAAIEMIVEKGGSAEVNLRSISRRLECAHTNVYNYFIDFDDLLWAAYRRALEIYAEYLTKGLEEKRTDYEYFLGATSRLASFPIENPGLHRFISTDRLKMVDIPPTILEMVGQMKIWWIDLVGVAGGEGILSHEADRIANIILAYVSGESTDIINGRVLPDENVRGRVVDNAINLFRVLTESLGATKTVLHERTGRNRHYPVMTVIKEEK